MLWNTWAHFGSSATKIHRNEKKAKFCWEVWLDFYQSLLLGLVYWCFNLYRAVWLVQSKARERLANIWKRMLAEKNSNFPSMRILDRSIFLWGAWKKKRYGPPFADWQTEGKRCYNLPWDYISRLRKRIAEIFSMVFTSGFTPIVCPCKFFDFPHTIPLQEAYFRQRH